MSSFLFIVGGVVTTLCLEGKKMKTAAVKKDKELPLRVPFFCKEKLSLLLCMSNYAALPLLILLLWQFGVSLKLFSPAILPSPEKVLATFGEEVRNGELAGDLLISLLRVLQGYSMAVVFGICFGALMGASLRANRFFTLVFDAVRQIPPMAWIPLLILWFGIGEAPKVIIIFKSAFFPILVNTISGIYATSGQYREVSKLYNTSYWDLMLKVYFPASLASIFVGLRLGLGAAWMTMVAAELIAASSGIGYRINDGRELSQPDLVIVGMIVIGIVGVVMDVLLTKLAKKLMYWQEEGA